MSSLVKALAKQSHASWPAQHTLIFLRCKGLFSRSKSEQNEWQVAVYQTLLKSLLLYTASLHCLWWSWRLWAMRAMSCLPTFPHKALELMPPLYWIPLSSSGSKKLLWGGHTCTSKTIPSHITDQTFSCLCCHLIFDLYELSWFKPYRLLFLESHWGRPTSMSTLLRTCWRLLLGNIV